LVLTAQSGSTTFDFIIKDSTETGTTERMFTFASTEYAVSALRPVMTIDYTCPESVGIVTNTLDDAAYNEAYSFTLTGTPTGGTWEVTTGTWPSGITLNGSTGVISGTPTESGTYPVTIKYTSPYEEPCDDYTTKSFSLFVYASTSNTGSDLISSVTETIAQTAQSFDYTIANNNQAYVLNLNTGYWTYISSSPFVNAIYRTVTKELIGTRRDDGQLSVINSGTTFDGTNISAIIQDGYMNFGELDEIKAMETSDSEAMKSYRAYYADIKGQGDLTMTVYTERDTSGESFTLDLSTVDNTTVNNVQTALSRDIQGKYVSRKIVNSSGNDFEIFEQRMKVKPRNIT
jgi:hypothetical protein